MAQRIPIRKAVPGKMVRGKFVRVKNPKGSKNIAMGFHAGGVFHPIRASDDYDPARAGEGGGKRKTKRKAVAKTKRKAAPKKKATKKKAAPKKKAAKKKKGKR